MKNKIIVSLSFLLLAAGTAFAGTGIPLTSDAAGAVPFTFKSSTNVSVYYSVPAAPAAIYAAITKNTAGDKFFASANDSSNIYYKQAAANIGMTASESTIITAVSAGVLTSTSWTSQ